MRLVKFLIFSLYVAVLIVMGAATFIEAAEGTPFVHREIYGTWWFSALWFALAFFGCVYIIRHIKSPLLHGKTREAVLLLHASFLVILLGAGISHQTGRSGTIHLRMNEPQDVAEITHNGTQYLHRLNFTVELKDFQTIEDEEGNAKDYRSDFRVLPKQERPVAEGPDVKRPVLGDNIAESLSVSMNNIAEYGNIRFYQSGYDSDLRGVTLMLNRDPYGIPVTYCGYALLFGSFVCIVFRGRRDFGGLRELRGLRIIGATLLLTALWCIYYFILDGSWAQIPVLRHPLLVFHVVIIILAYALLLIQTVCSVAFCCRNLRHPMHPKLPAPANTLLRSALCLLSIGIFLGAIWANISWGNYWSWDAKEVWALITLMIYAVPLHKRSLPIFNNPRVYHAYIAAAFLTVLMTYFGVNHLLTGLHSYN